MKLNINQIKEIIPHRFPFLLIDRVLSLQPGISATGIKNITTNEWYLQGHFPEYPVVPGVLITEALAQLGAIAVLTLPENRGKIGFLAGVDKFKFRRQVIPGDTLTLQIEIIKNKRNVGKGAGRALVGEQVAAEGEIMFALGAAPAPESEAN